MLDTPLILACTLPAFPRRSAARAALLLRRAALLLRRADRAALLLRRAARAALLLARELLRSRAPLRRELLPFFVCLAARKLVRELLRPARYLGTSARAMPRLLRRLPASKLAALPLLMPLVVAAAWFPPKLPVVAAAAALLRLL